MQLASSGIFWEDVSMQLVYTIIFTRKFKLSFKKNLYQNAVKHNELKRGKTYILAGQCTVCLRV